MFLVGCYAQEAWVHYSCSGQKGLFYPKNHSIQKSLILILITFLFLRLRVSKIWSYLPNPSAREVYDTRSIIKRSLTDMNSEFSFSLTSCLTKAEEPSLSYYLPIAGERIFGFIPFPRVVVLCEMQSVRSRIWTRVAVSISCNDNQYTTCFKNMM